MWKQLKNSGNGSAHYSVMSLDGSDGMEALREMFPEGKANDLNFVLFSTSGVHGTYNTIESAEKYLSGDEDEFGEVTFLIVHPRLVALRYGNCEPRNLDDIEFLKRLRGSSHNVANEIGMEG